MDLRSWPGSRTCACAARRPAASRAALFSCMEVTSASPPGAARRRCGCPSTPAGAGCRPWPRRTTAWRRCNGEAAMRLPLASNASPVTVTTGMIQLSFSLAPVLRQTDAPSLPTRARDHACHARPLAPPISCEPKVARDVSDAEPSRRRPGAGAPSSPPVMNPSAPTAKATGWRRHDTAASACQSAKVQRAVAQREGGRVAAMPRPRRQFTVVSATTNAPRTSTANASPRVGSSSWQSRPRVRVGSPRSPVKAEGASSDLARLEPAAQLRAVEVAADEHQAGALRFAGRATGR